MNFFEKNILEMRLFKYFEVIAIIQDENTYNWLENC